MLGLLAGRAWGQAKTFERSFPAAPADVELGLRSLQAHSTAKLPTLFGFVVTQEPNLNAYSQAYYQYSIVVVPRGSTETQVKITAKITAWFTDQDAAKSGYRELASNGRLELDLLDRLGRSLGEPTPVRDGSMATHASIAAGKERANPANSSTVVFPQPSTISENLPKREDLAALAARNTDEQRVQQLKKEIASLEEILHNQSRPSDLAAVRNPGVAVYDQPLDTGQILFRADAEDEFRVVEDLGEWVHVQISGISRGWIQRSQLEMPGANPGRTPSGIPATGSGPPVATREETTLFPGDWARLRGRKVKILWVSGPTKPEGGRWAAARSAFRSGMAGMDPHGEEEGIAVVFDAADGGMAAATLSDLQRWVLGELSDEAFRRLCWLDPSDAFQGN
jgi:hypothetical protein